MNFIMYIYMLMFFFSILVFTNLYKQILISLLSLEFIMLSLLMIMSLLMYLSLNLIIIFYYLVFVVCESVLGLTLLVIYVRNFGNDSMKFLNLLW